MYNMSDPLYLQQANRTANEPKVHSLVRKSFVFVPSAGMRSAPEVLILELMRELFFHDFGGETRMKNLDPSDENGSFYTLKQQAVLYALRGRRKTTKNSKVQDFFAPAYPELAKSAWLRKNEARVVNNFLLGGPVAQYLWHKGETEEKKREQEAIAEKVRKALLGAKSFFDGSPEGKDILAVTLGMEAFCGPFSLSERLPIEKMKEKTKYSDSVMKIGHDDLAEIITKDLESVCELEAGLPRMQWLQVFMTFLRFALPMWLLAQMRITNLLHAWLLDAIDKSKVLDGAAIAHAVAERNKGLLHPTLTATRELYEHVDYYIKRRVELSILLYCLEEIRPDRIKGKRLGLRQEGTDTLGIEDLLIFARESADDIKGTDHFRNVAGGFDVSTFLTRAGENFSGWRNPRMRGQGKNIDEFFRVLYREEMGDEAGGYLLTPEGRGRSRGFRVFPGQLLLKTITYLAAQNKRSQGRGGAGKLVLQDVEEWFARYGVDFSSAADARPLLMRELQAMGLLTGSPDAGSSVAVACPY